MTAVGDTIDPGRLARIRARRARGAGHLHGQSTENDAPIPGVRRFSAGNGNV